MKNYGKFVRGTLSILAIIVFILLSSVSFAKSATQATCGLGSGGGTLGTNFKYQTISNFRPFKVHILSQKTKNSTGELLQQYERVINFELTSFPADSTVGSKFAIVSIEDSNPNN